MTTFAERFLAAVPEGIPAGCQLVFRSPALFSTEALAEVIRNHPEAREATVEFVDAAEFERDSELLAEVNHAGPPAARLGLVSWGKHIIRIVECHAPMPYGPLQTCVDPAFIDPALKEAAHAHTAHMLLYYCGTEHDPFEQFAAVVYTAAAVARFGSPVILNEEARSAIPAADLIPDSSEEDIYATIRGLPLPYFAGGFVKLDLGDGSNPWVRTFANHRFGLPNLALQLSQHEETTGVFRLFAGLLGYLRKMDATFESGDEIDLAGDGKLSLRKAEESEWYLASDGELLVITVESLPS